MDADAGLDDPGTPETTRTTMSEAESPFRLGYRPEFDGLRALSILAVLLMHAPIPGWRGGFLRGGWVGVDVFFVLSGFLITTLLLDERRRTSVVSLRRFYVRRLLRLGPALVVMLVAWSSYAWLALPAAEARLTCRQSLVTLFYSSNWVMAFDTMPMYELGPTWSLAVEEQFYLFWPPICVGLLAIGVRSRGLLGVLVAGTACSAILRLVLFVAGTGNARLYYGSDTRADALLIGCIVGVLAARGTLAGVTRHRRALGALAACAAVLLVWVGLTRTQEPRELYLGLLTLIAVAVALVLVWVLCSPDSRVTRALALPPLVWIGRRSYGIYLWHMPAAAAIASPLTAILGDQEPHWTLPLGVFLATSLAVAGVSFRYVEAPMLALKGRYAGVREAAPERPSVVGPIGDPVPEDH